MSVIQGYSGDSSSAGENAHTRLVVHVITRFLRGGSERRLLDCIDALPDASHVVLAGEISGGDRLADRGIQPEVLPGLRRDVDPFSDLTALFALRRAIRGLQPSALILHQSKAAALGRAAAAISGRQPPTYVSLSMQWLDELAGPTRRLARSVERLLARRTTRYLACGQDLVRLFAAEVRLDLSHFRLVRSSIELEPFLSKRGTSPSDVPTVVFIGTLEHRKGAHLLPALGRAIADEIPNLRMRILGDGPLRGWLQSELPAVPGLEVEMPGHVHNVSELLADAHCLCLPSRAEGLPQVLVQASAIGVPFVAFDVCGVAEMTTLGEGKMVPRDDSEAMVRAMIPYLKTSTRFNAPPEASLLQWAPNSVFREYRDALAV